MRHAYCNFGTATLGYVDKAMRSPPHQPHRTAMQASIGLTSWIFGWLAKNKGETPLDWLPKHAETHMDGRYTIQAWWLALIAADMRTHSTGGNKGSGEPLDKDNELFKQACDGGGPGIWETGNGFSLANTQAGVVRAVDIYGGRDAEGKGKWMTWKQVKTHYIRGHKFKAAMDKMNSEYAKRIRQETERPGELTAWLEWYSRL